MHTSQSSSDYLCLLGDVQQSTTMKHTKLITLLLVLFLSSVIAENISAQRRTSRRTRTETTTKVQDWFAISLGSIGFGRGFSISGKFSYGFEFEERFSIGANAKFFYDNINNFGGPDQNFFTFGGAAFTRIKITKEIFAHGEYNYTKFDDAQFINNTKVYPSVGGGYKSGYDNWSYGFHVLLPLDEQVRDVINLEYWIDFNYKF